MEELDLQSLVLNHYGLRLEPEMIRYATRRLQSLEQVDVIGGDSRTGVPRRQMIGRAILSSQLPDQRTLFSV